MEQKKGRKNSYLSFKIKNEEYAIHVNKVLNILNYRDVVKIPKTPDYIKGIIKYRRKPVTIIDLAQKLGLEKSKIGENSCFIVLDIIVDGEKVNIGLIVDEVVSILEIIEEEIERQVWNENDIISESILGIALIDKYLINILDIDRIFMKSELEQIVEKVLMKSEAA